MVKIAYKRKRRPRNGRRLGETEIPSSTVLMPCASRKPQKANAEL